MPEAFNTSKNPKEVSVATAVIDTTFGKQTAALEQKKSRVGKYILAGFGASLAAKATGYGLAFAEGAKIDAAHDILTNTNNSVGTGVAFGLIDAGSIGFGATALVGLGVLINRYINKKKDQNVK